MSIRTTLEPVRQWIDLHYLHLHRWMGIRIQYIFRMDQLVVRAHQVMAEQPRSCGRSCTSPGPRVAPRH
jgi:hypothetical protein